MGFLWTHQILDGIDGQEENFSLHIRVYGTLKLKAPWMVKHESERRFFSRVDKGPFHAFSIDDHSTRFHVGQGVEEHLGPKIVPNVVHILDGNDCIGMELERHLCRAKRIALYGHVHMLLGLSQCLGGTSDEEENRKHDQ